MDAQRQNLEESFTRLVNEIRRPLVHYLAARVGSQADAEDLAQRVLARAWADFGKLPHEGGYDASRSSYYTWLLRRFGDFEVREHWRQHKRRGPLVPLQAEDGKPVADPPDPGDPGAAELAARAEALGLRAAALDELLRLFFLCGGYPHQQLACGLSKHVFGRPSNRGIEGDPQRVDAEHGAAALAELADIYAERYAAAARAGGARVEALERAMVPLRARLPLTVEQLVADDKASLAAVEAICARPVAETTLRDYYARRKGGFMAAIPDWSYKIERRLREVLGLEADATPAEAADAVADRLRDGPVEPAGCPRCKLRHAPPCGG